MIGATNPFSQRSLPLPSDNQAPSTGRAGGSPGVQQNEQLPRLKNGPIEDTFIHANAETANTQMGTSSKTATTGVGQASWMDNLKKLFQAPQVDSTQKVAQPSKAEQPDVNSATQKVTAPDKSQQANTVAERPVEDWASQQQQKPNAFQAAAQKKVEPPEGPGSLGLPMVGAGMLTMPVAAPTAMVAAPAASVKAITSTVAPTISA